MFEQIHVRIQIYVRKISYSDMVQTDGRQNKANTAFFEKFEKEMQ